MIIKSTPLLVVNGLGNAEEMILQESGAAADLSLITRMVLVFGTLIIDSLTSPAAFDWSLKITALEAARNPRLKIGDCKLELQLGFSSIPEGHYKAPLIVYDADNPNGLFWGYFNTTVIAVGQA